MAGQDVLATPGELVQVEVRLRKTSLFWEPKPTGVYIFLDGNVYHAAKTDSNGAVFASFRPPAVGDYPFHVECYAKPGQPPVKTDILVACREANRPLFVSDIDQTLSCWQERREVLFGAPNAMSGAAEVMTRIARDYSVLYLTHRWDYLAKRTHRWLNAKGFPGGPIFAARGWSELVADNEKFKTAVLARISGRFHGGGFGIGDQASDVLAYEGSGLRGILFIDRDGLRKPSKVQEAIQQVELVPASAQVVLTWAEAEKVVFDGAKFPPAAAKERLTIILLNLEKQGR